MFAGDHRQNLDPLWDSRVPCSWDNSVKGENPDITESWTYLDIFARGSCPLEVGVSCVEIMEIMWCICIREPYLSLSSHLPAKGAKLPMLQMWIERYVVRSLHVLMIVLGPIMYLSVFTVISVFTDVWWMIKVKQEQVQFDRIIISVGSMQKLLLGDLVCSCVNLSKQVGVRWI